MTVRIVADAAEARRRLAGRNRLTLFNAYCRLHMPQEMFDARDAGRSTWWDIPVDAALLRGYGSETKLTTAGVLLLFGYIPVRGRTTTVYRRGDIWDEDLDRLSRIEPIIYQ
jgi:hypothetical protein